MSDWLNAQLVRVAQLGEWGVVLFLGLYVVVALTATPAFPLTVAAGAIYGVARGSVLVFVGASLGGSLAFGVATRLAGSRWLRRLDRDPRVLVVRQALSRGSFWVQFLLRLSPIIPFTLLNYALGMARVRFKDFALALVGMIPAIIVYTYYGKVVGDVTKLAAGVSPPRGTGYYLLLGVGLVTTVVASAFITKATRSVLRR
jgi:uncharacterized membrane protein YdjX (TVP38/TMEM64 family)